MNMMRTQMRFLAPLLGVVLSAIPVGCSSGSSDRSGGGNSNPSTPPPTPTGTLGSSGSSSGALGVFTKEGVSYTVTPVAFGSSPTLLSFPNTGTVVGIITTHQVQATPINTSLTAIDGTAVDPVHDVGLAFASHGGEVSLFALSTANEVGTYDTLTAGTLRFYNAALVKIAGAIMNPANQTMILATADGFEVVDYTDPAAAVLVREIPSRAADAVNGVEIMENFAFDPAVPLGGTNHALIITGGNQGGSDPFMTLVDADTGAVYRPDSATGRLFTIDQTNPVAGKRYLDAAAVDTGYHVAVLADGGAGTIFVDLNQLTLDATAGTYALPSAAVHRITTYFSRTYLTIESTNHLVMMGGECGTVGLVVGQLSDPASALGFGREALLRELPAAFDNVGTLVNGWFSACAEPHAVGAYLTPPDHPVYTTPTSLGLWLNDALDHVAIIDIQGVLDGLLSDAPYVPTLPTPQDIAYFAIPKNYALSVSKAGTGGGTVTGPRIDCGATCSAPFNAGTVVTLAATPDATSTFTGWSGACSGTGTCNVTMDAAKVATATFTRNQLTLSVLKNGTGGGTVTGSGIDCGATCSALLDTGTEVTLTATPDATSTFTGWSGGACSGAGDCVVLMTATQVVTATFTANNTPPVANAGPDQTVNANDAVSLDGSASIDAEVNPLTFRWSFVSVPIGSTAVLSDAAVVNPTFIVDLPGTYVIQLVVNDGTDDSAPDTVTITVN